jgi:hypothetical protein
VKNDCPCFSSDDCGPGFTCRSEDSSGLNVFCVPGARGVGKNKKKNPENRTPGPPPEAGWVVSRRQDERQRTPLLRDVSG